MVTVHCNTSTHSHTPVSDPSRLNYPLCLCIEHAGSWCHLYLLIPISSQGWTSGVECLKLIFLTPPPSFSCTLSVRVWTLVLKVSISEQPSSKELVYNSKTSHSQRNTSWWTEQTKKDSWRQLDIDFGQQTQARSTKPSSAVWPLNSRVCHWADSDELQVGEQRLTAFPTWPVPAQAPKLFAF